MENISHYIVEKTFQKRHILSIYSFFGYFVAYSQRTLLSVAILDMVKDASQFGATNISLINATSQTIRHSIETNIDAQIYNQAWSPILQGYILSAFFYGYILTQIPASFLSNKFGGKLFFGAGNGFCSLFCILIPACVLISPYSLIAIRILQGMFQGFVFPSMHCIWSKWAPPNERSRLSSFGISGSYIGSVISLSVGGIIGQYLNWQAMFYLFGTFGLLWTVLWFCFTSETPAKHSSISIDEKNHIESSLTNSGAHGSIPWLSILKSGPFWAIAAFHFAENWGFYTMLTKMPTFFSDQFNFKIDKVGIISALPYLVMSLFLYSSGFISDKMIDKNFSFKFVRRTFCCVGFLFQAFFMFSIVFSSNQFGLIVFMTLAIAFGGMVWASFAVNMLDIGAGFASVLMSLSNTIATLPGILSPAITGYLTKNKMKSEWNTVFCISAVIYLIGTCIFMFFSSAKTQAWAVVEVKSKNERNPVTTETNLGFEQNKGSNNDP